MPRIWIPPLLRDLTGGVESLDVAGSRVSDLIDELDRHYPGIRSRLREGDQLRSGLTVVVDSEVSPRGLSQVVQNDSEVHFLPGIGGG